MNGRRFVPFRGFMPLLSDETKFFPARAAKTETKVFGISFNSGDSYQTNAFFAPLPNMNVKPATQ
jgi:hypothetical protein